jgi:hypothetical protein
LHDEAHVGTTYKRALEMNFSGLLAPFQPVPATILHYARRSTTLSSSSRMEDMMRKPRDFDAELKALEEKARQIKVSKVQQLGELVIATGADALGPDELAGALIVLAETKDAGKREAWAKRGAAFFHGRSRRAASAPGRDAGGAPAQPGGAQPASGGAGAA